MGLWRGGGGGHEGHASAPHMHVSVFGSSLHLEFLMCTDWSVGQGFADFGIPCCLFPSFCLAFVTISRLAVVRRPVHPVYMPLST